MCFFDWPLSFVPILDMKIAAGKSFRRRRWPTTMASSAVSDWVKRSTSRISEVIQGQFCSFKALIPNSSVVFKTLSPMELLFVFFFATNLFYLAEANQVNDYDGEAGDLFELPPDINPVAGFHDGPLPEFIELNLHVKYDLTLLEWFGGSKEAAEFYVRTVIQLAEPSLRHPKLDIKIYIKVAVILFITENDGIIFLPTTNPGDCLYFCLSVTKKFL